MAGIVLGALVGFGLALAGIFTFRWASHRYLDGEAQAPAAPRTRDAA